MRTVYFHCASGISGDMCVGALIHAGADFTALKEQLNTLPLQGYEITYTPIIKNGISVGKFDVSYQDNHPHRGLKDIIQIIDQSGLSHEIKEKSTAIFTRLAHAEAAVHGTTPEKIHFHEVGAVDAIIDIVGTVICLSLLEVERVVCSPLPMGHGFISCAHGVLPIPAPATRELLREVPQYGIDIEGELVTPTGAAIISTLAESFGPLPLMTIDTFGYGAGTKEYPIPNMLSVSLSKHHSDNLNLLKEEVHVVETTIDDMNPELFSYLWEIIFTTGALDMYLTPVQMKKGRPGSLVTVICETDNTDAIVRTLITETSSLGVRIRKEYRRCCQRRKTTVQTTYGEVGVKVGIADKYPNLAPEYEDCKKLAEMHQVPIKEIYLEALITAKNKQTQIK